MFPIFSLYSVQLIMILFLVKRSSTSKLNEVVILSINDIFDGSNNLIHNSPLSFNSTTDVPVWRNEGFLGANATQITSSLGKTTDISTKLLLATKSSSITTQLKDFDHTFLSIKFSSIIGHSESNEQEESLATPDPLYIAESGEFVTAPVTTSPTEAEEITSPKKDIVQSSPPPKVVVTPKISSNKTPTVIMSLIPKETPVISPLGPVSVLVAQIAKPPQLKPQEKVDPKPTTPPILRVSSPQPAILKLNAEGSDGNQVIEIEIDQAAIPTNATPGIEKSNPISSLVVPKEVVLKSEQIYNVRAERTKRELDSEEITQIQNILTLTKNIKTKEKEKKPKEKNKVQEEIILAQEAEGAEESEIEESEVEETQNPKEVKKKVIEASIAKKLSYNVWRASMQKSFRPPGFYVTVDEKVVYDNWVGVWQSSQSPSVMGRWSSPKSNRGIWNDTVLMVEFDEDPGRNVKITFEWEPIDPNSYLFLSNIKISTYGSDATAKAIELSNHMNVSASSGDSSHNLLSIGNRNITLFIVVKTPTPQETNQEKTNGSASTKKTETSINPGIQDPYSTYNKKLSSGTKSFSNVGIIVACSTGGISLVILVFLIYKKLQLSRNSSSIC